MKAKTTIPRSIFACPRCGRGFFVREQAVEIETASGVVAVHPSKRCWSEWEDRFVRQVQVSKNGQRILPVGPNED